MSLITFVVGARPNFVKAAPVVAAVRRRPVLESRLVHTGQHYDDEMSSAFFRDLGMPEPDAWLGVRSSSHAAQTADVMRALEPELTDRRPDMVVVFGDVNSTLAAALTAAKLGLPVAHVESGLRSYDRSMPEEINRVLTDHVCDLLFVTEQSGVDNLEREGIDPSKVKLVGNTMIDSLVRLLPIARQRRTERGGPYAVLTLHRPSNVDDESRLRRLLQALGSVGVPVVFPVHPRTAKSLGDAHEGIVQTPPLGYLDFLALMDGAAVVLTDSGGIQEETTALGVPCVTIRENTERPVTIERGTNVLAGVDPAGVLDAARDALSRPRAPAPDLPLWDGSASVRIADVLERWLG